MDRNNWRRISLVLPVLLLGAAAVKPATYNERVQEYMQQWEKKPANPKKFPTPEVTLVQPPRLLTAFAGQSITVGGKGVVPKGSLVMLDCVDAKSQTVKSSPKGILVTAKVPDLDLPSPCSLHVRTPFRDVARRVFQIGGTYRWTLQLANGMSAEITAASQPDPEAERAQYWDTRPRQVRFIGSSVWKNATGVIGGREMNLTLINGVLQGFAGMKAWGLSCNSVEIHPGMDGQVTGTARACRDAQEVKLTGSYVAVGPSTFNQRYEAIRSAAWSERVKLQDKVQTLYTKFPTPEITLVPASPVVAAPGQTVVVKAEGKVPKGTQFLFDCDELEVTSSKIGSQETSVSVKVPVAMAATTKPCQLHAYARASLGHTAVPALEVAAKYVWSLDLSNGMHADLTLIDRAGKRDGQSVWRRGDQAIGTKVFTVQGTGAPIGPGVQFSVSRSSEDNAAVDAAWKADPAAPELAKVEAEMAKINANERTAEGRADEDCLKKSGYVNDSKQYQCRKDAKKQLEAQFGPSKDALRKKAEPFYQRRNQLTGNHPAGCNWLILTSGEDGKVVGKGQGCTQSDAADVTGTLAISAP